MGDVETNSGGRLKYILILLLLGGAVFAVLALTNVVDLRASPRETHTNCGSKMIRAPISAHCSAVGWVRAHARCGVVVRVFAR